ncbi:hypothetical protein [Flavobacterium sp.]|uniref:hypothetical protein n=1 Tax=Flavobacterium sp. TaxID=239 RepID=UPI003B9BFEAE
MLISNTRNARKILPLFFLIFVCSTSVSQKNTFIVPTQFEWQTKENQYRISTVLKTKLVEYGYAAYYSSEVLPDNVSLNACNNFTIKAVRIKGTFNSKIRLDVLDCQNQIVLQSEVGSSKEKEYELAYREALEKALVDLLPKLNAVARKIQAPVSNTPTEPITATPANIQSAEQSTAKKDITVNKNSRGYTLITNDGLVIQLQITSQPNTFLAFLDTKPAVAFYNNGKLLFEYYEENKKVAVNYDVKLPQ